MGPLREASYSGENHLVDPSAPAVGIESKPSQILAKISGLSANPAKRSQELISAPENRLAATTAPAEAQTTATNELGLQA